MGEAEDRPRRIGEEVGYAATVAWLPSVLLGGMPPGGDFDALCALLPAPLAPFAELCGVMPAALCLLLCIAMGAALMLLSDRIVAKKQFFGLWMAAIACTAACLCVPSRCAPRSQS